MTPKRIQETTGRQEPPCGGAGVDDRLLLQRVINDKDMGAFADLYAAYYPRLVRYIAAHTRGAAEAEDWAQDVFIRLWETRARYVIGESAVAYLFAVANQVIAWHTRRGRRRRHRTVADPGVESLVTCEMATGHDLADRISAVLLPPGAETAGFNLSPKSREAIRLRFIQGLSTPEAAHASGCSVAAFYSRLERALRSLRRIERTDL